MPYIKSIMISFLASVLLIGCGGSSNGTSGPLKLSLTDAPVEDALSVMIHFTGVTIQPENGERYTIDVTDPDNPQNTGRSIDLLKLQDGESTVLFDEHLEIGRYSWIRLNVDLDISKSYMLTSTGTHELRCTSCEQNGLKLNRSFEMSSSAGVAFMLDFDLRKSISAPQSGDHFNLRPTIRIIDAVATTGNISGTVETSLIDSLGGLEGCNVYAYTGADITPEDIWVDSATPSDYNNPVTTAGVKLDDSTGDYVYTLAYLPENSYTISLTCDGENDHPDTDDTNVTFTETANVVVTAGETTTHDFAMTPIAAP